MQDLMKVYLTATFLLFNFNYLKVVIGHVKNSWDRLRIEINADSSIKKNIKNFITNGEQSLAGLLQLYITPAHDVIFSDISINYWNLKSTPTIIWNSISAPFSKLSFYLALLSIISLSSVAIKLYQWASVRSRLYECIKVTHQWHNGKIVIIPTTIVMVHLEFVLFLYGCSVVARAQLYTPWNVTDCIYQATSCNTEEQKVRDCETVCFENRTCEIRIAAIFPNDSFYIVNLEEVLMNLMESGELCFRKFGSNSRAFRRCCSFKKQKNKQENSNWYILILILDI